MEKVHDEDEMQIDLRELLFALKKRILIIFAAFLGGAAVAAAYTQLMVTPLYSSTAKLLVLSKETTLTSLADLQLGSQLASDYSVLLTSRIRRIPAFLKLRLRIRIRRWQKPS